MQKYTILDTEMVFDRYLTEAYQEINPKCEKTRIAARKLNMIALLDISIDELGRISVGRLRSWTTEHQDEGAMLTSAFDDLRSSADRTLVTYGGSAMDAKVIELAAMSHDLALPPQLVQAFGPRTVRPAHLDINAAMKGFGKTWHHLSEVLVRIGIPVALIRDKANPDLPFETGNWDLARQHCELDTLLTAIALVAWRRIQGDPCLRIPEATFVLIEGYLRQRPAAIAAPVLRGEQACFVDNISRTEAEAA
ncbi:MAG: hypothetical protein V7676_06770 [Parasphingorhabdus sp.]|uniref:hypothetical protein n=1 Tax=Parasphingorhabdus sp. TaxID=2709688 RepID=UPI003001B237